MAQSVQDVRRRRLLVEKEHVAGVEARCASLQSAYDNAAHAYRAALAVMQELKAELDDVREQHVSAVSRLEVVRATYLRELMARLPDDILRHIFVHALPIQEHADFMLKSPHRFGNFRGYTNGPALPFALACVCKQWRDVALGLTALWATIYVREANPEQLARVQLLLERSKAAPLDIVFDVNNDGPGDIGMSRMILDALQENIWRWRQVQQAHLSERSPVGPDDLTILLRPAPQLLRFHIHMTGAATDGEQLHPDEYSLQITPRIQQLILISPWMLAPKLPYTFPALVSLVWNQPGAHFLWELLLSTRDTLKDLVYAPTSEPFDVVPARDVNFPFTMSHLEQLHILTLHGSATPRFNMLKAPCLTTLTVMSTLHVQAMRPFFETINPSVKTLILHGDSHAVALETLSTLANVEHLFFAHDHTIFKVTYTVFDDLFGCLAVPYDTPGATPAWVWPKLSTIFLASRGSLQAGTGQNLLQLVRARTLPDLDDSSIPRRLTNVELEDTMSPMWLRDEIKRMF